MSQKDTLAKAFAHHQPALSQCWLIASADTLNVANEFKEEHEVEGRAIHLKVIDDPFDWQETKRLIDEIYSALPEGWSESDMITDFTGLTKPASMGAILSCLIPGRPLQYVPAIYEN
ncbi:MAG: hypothetical protein ACRENG_32710, partial [bacterium]